MANTEQRGFAGRIKEGCPVSDLPEGLPQKTQSTGYFAQALAGVEFAVIEDRLRASRDRTSRGLMRALDDSLYEQVSTLTHGCEHAPLLTELLNGRAERAGKPTKPHALRVRTRQGSDVGVTSIAASLDTLIIRTKRGEPLTERGLMESQRVPFALAMLTFKTLDATYAGAERDATRREQDAYGIGRTVLLDRATTMRPAQGLALRPEYVVDLPIEDPEEPNLGCPVTLIPGFVRNLFGVVASAALEKGIISVTD